MPQARTDLRSTAAAELPGSLIIELDGTATDRSGVDTLICISCDEPAVTFSGDFGLPYCSLACLTAALDRIAASSATAAPRSRAVDSYAIRNYLAMWNTGRTK